MRKFKLLAVLLLLTPTFAQISETRIQQAIAEKEIVEAKGYDKYDYLFKNALEGQRDYFLDLCNENEVNPVLALAISAHETGYFKSNLAINKNNFGGMLVNGQGIEFKDKETGIKKFIELLAKYRKSGLDTPEKMVNRYAEGSETWTTAVKSIMTEIEEKVK